MIDNWTKAVTMLVSVGIVAIMIVAFALTGCTIKSPSYAPPDAPPVKTWHIVTTFTGEETEFLYKNTDIFHIQGARWKMTWTSIPTNKNLSIFSVFVYPEGETVNQITFSLSPNGETIIHQGNGNYYLTIVGGLLYSWSIRIYDYY